MLVLKTEVCFDFNINKHEKKIFTKILKLKKMTKLNTQK